MPAAASYTCTLNVNIITISTCTSAPFSPAISHCSYKSNSAWYIQCKSLYQHNSSSKWSRRVCIKQKRSNVIVYIVFIIGHIYLINFIWTGERKRGLWATMLTDVTLNLTYVTLNLTNLDPFMWPHTQMFINEHNILIHCSFIVSVKKVSTDLSNVFQYIYCFRSLQVCFLFI